MLNLIELSTYLGKNIFTQVFPVLLLLLQGIKEMAMKIQLHENFHPTEEIWQKVEEAVENGLTSFTILSNGSIINSDDEVKVGFGPVVGEVTESSATIVIETSCASESSFPLTCQLFVKNDDDQQEDPIQVMEKDVTSRRPHAFQFENLIPNTQYTVWFSTSPSPTMASFKTKKEDMDSFRMIALSCDRYGLWVAFQKWIF